jgi:ribosome-associated protein
MPSQRKNKQRGSGDNPISRSQRKRDSSALQKLAEVLTRLAPGQWQKLPLTPDLLEALHLWRRISDHEGRRRQLQYLGRLMREADAAAIEAALSVLRDGNTKENILLRHTERLREALIQAKQSERKKLLAQWPEAEEELRRLLDAIRLDSGPARRGAYRALFRRLRELQNNEHMCHVCAPSSQTLP